MKRELAVYFFRMTLEHNHIEKIKQKRGSLEEMLAGLLGSERTANCQRVIMDLVRITGGRWWVCDRGGVMVELGPEKGPIVMRFLINEQTSESVIGAIEERLPDGSLRRAAGIELHLTPNLVKSS